MSSISRNILENAETLTSLDRQSEYGHPLDNFTHGASIFSALINRRYNTNINLDWKDYGAIMLAVKLDRLAGKYSEDTITDIAGYARCLQLCHDEELMRKKEKE